MLAACRHRRALLAFAPSPVPFLVLMALGFLVGVAGPRLRLAARDSRPGSG